jgi:hypothetical protein
MPKSGSGDSTQRGGGDFMCTANLLQVKISSGGIFFFARLSFDAELKGFVAKMASQL